MEFKHPNYYKNLRKLYRSRNRDQAISPQAATAANGRTPGTGLEVQIIYQDLSDLKLTSYKLPGPKPISEGNKGLIHKRKGGRVGPKSSSSV